MNAAETVRAYAQAKSRADTDGALRHVADDVVLETFAFGLTTWGKDQARAAFDGLFAIFLDYTVHVDGMIEQEGAVAAWGQFEATQNAPFLSQPGTGSRFRLSYACVWDVRDGLIARERFYFDLHDLCGQLGLDPHVAATDFAALQTAFDDPHPAPAD